MEYRKIRTMINYKRAIVSSILVGVGLGLGSIGTLFMLSNNHPTIVVEDKWKTITTAPTTPLDLGHTSLNPDEIRNLLSLESQPRVAGVTTTSVPPTTQTTNAPPIVVQPTVPLPTQPPSTLPPSSTTSTSGTTTSTTVTTPTTAPTTGTSN